MRLQRTTKTKNKKQIIFTAKKDITFLWRIIIRERRYR
ncbi:hypothetical protein HMPREF1147_0420 [Selenomonas sp. FOBRC9]|nr:hypothetical protein HMPREF1147_0420 [Selenomonas sp. FOBRC9]